MANLWNETSVTRSSFSLEEMLNLNSSTTNSSSEVREELGRAESTLTTYFTYINFSLRILWAIFALFGNTLTIAAVGSFERLQTKSNLLICNLAVGDLLTVFLPPLQALHDHYADTAIFVPACLTEKFINLVSARANAYGITLIAVERLVYISYPLRYHSILTWNRILAVMALIWSYNTIESFLLLLLGNNLSRGEPCKYPVFLGKIYTQILLPELAIFILLTVGIYAAIAKIAHTQAKRIANLNQPYNTLEASTMKVQRKIAKMMFQVFASYLISYLPQAVLGGLLQKYKSDLTKAIEAITHLIFYTNSWFNPIIYAGSSLEFRIAFKKLLTRNEDLHFPWGTYL